MSKIKIGSKAHLQLHHSALEKQVTVIDKVLDQLFKSKTELYLGLYTLCYSVNDSARSLLLLTPNVQLRDCYVIARTILELIVNIGYILSKGESAYEKAKRHLEQKSFRDLKRELRTKDFKISVNVDGIDTSSTPKELLESIDQYTSKKGKEIKNWTEESVLQKIEIIKESFGNQVAEYLYIMLFHVYRHASEVAHGTFFSIYHISGGTAINKPKTSYTEMADHQRSSLSLILLSTCMGMDALVRMFSQKLELEEEMNESMENINTLVKVLDVDWPEEIDDIFEFLKKSSNPSGSTPSSKK